MINKNQYLLLVLFLSIVIIKSISSIFYIEDIDSLRFALSIYDKFDLSILQPHFPGYPVFCFFAKIIYLGIGSLGLSFSIIGAISTFIIIYFSLLITNFNISSKEGLFTVFIILFNPMIFLLSNRYMPDLMGLSVFVASFYFLTSKEINKVQFGIFLYAILCGVRLSYFPLLIIPSAMALRSFSRNAMPIFLAFFVGGIIVWLLPMIYITGFNDLITIATKQSSGHFSDYGGTFITEGNWFYRFKFSVQTLWSDGLGGYWIGRSKITIIPSLFMIFMVYPLYQLVSRSLRENNSLKILINSAFLYLIWIMMFQNVIYKSRHVLPIVFVVLILVSSAQIFYFKKQKILNYISKFLLIVSLALISINLCSQHKDYTSIYRVKEYLLNSKSEYNIASTPLINFYLKSTGINRRYYNVDDLKDIDNLYNNSESEKIIMIGDFRYRLNEESIFIQDTIFYHNPYMNRMWSTIDIYSN